MENLKDPLADRHLSSLSLPPIGPLHHDILYSNNKPCLDTLTNHLKQEGKISKLDCVQIISEASAFFSSEPNLLQISEPVTIIGDIHGQFYDLLNILEQAGSPSLSKLLFLGDYVDRGCFSMEVVLLLYAYKINFPDSVFLLRGNHESRGLSSYFNFRTEVLNKFDLEVYERIMNSFDYLPIACVVGQKYLCVHGGISPGIRKLRDIDLIDRKTEVPSKGELCDLLWADPLDSEVGTSIEKFRVNCLRGCSFFFSVTAANEFLHDNSLLSIIRAHEVQIDGYKMHKWNGNSSFPVVITIFSAPNYCDVYNNKGAILKLANNGLNVQQYNYTYHPYILPNFMNAFTWSVPFIIEKTLEMIYSLIPKTDDDPNPATESKNPLKTQVFTNKVQKFKKKIAAVTSMMKNFNTLRQDHESIIRLKGMCPDNKIPKDLLSQEHSAILGAIQAFNHAKALDKQNEKHPFT